MGATELVLFGTVAILLIALVLKRKNIITTAQQIIISVFALVLQQLIYSVFL